MLSVDGNRFSIAVTSWAPNRFRGTLGFHFGRKSLLLRRNTTALHSCCYPFIHARTQRSSMNIFEPYASSARRLIPLLCKPRQTASCRTLRAKPFIDRFALVAPNVHCALTFSFHLFTRHNTKLHNAKLRIIDAVPAVLGLYSWHPFTRHRACHKLPARLQHRLTQESV